jgi:hypothetical protein
MRASGGRQSPRLQAQESLRACPKVIVKPAQPFAAGEADRRHSQLLCGRRRQGALRSIRVVQFVVGLITAELIAPLAGRLSLRPLRPGCARPKSSINCRQTPS